jgi:PBP1b-binding outer membrane lipoprotein LpoB
MKIIKKILLMIATITIFLSGCNHDNKDYEINRDVNYVIAGQDPVEVQYTNGQGVHIIEQVRLPYTVSFTHNAQIHQYYLEVRRICKKSVHEIFAEIILNDECLVYMNIPENINTRYIQYIK